MFWNPTYRIQSLAKRTAFLAIVLLPAAAMSQDLVVPATPEQSEVTLSPTPVEDDAGHSIVIQQNTVDSETGFWFLATDNSPQSFRNTCPRFCPYVSRYEECAGFSRSAFSEMLARIEPGVPVCIMVHGSFVDRASACHEARCTWKWLKHASRGCRMQFIAFSWPSYRPVSITAAFDANQLGRRAERNGYYLAELIAQLPQECPVSLIGHSHGTRVIASGLHLMAGGDIRGVRHPWARNNGRLIRSVFCAAAIDHDWLNPGHRYDRALCSVQCVLNLKNCHDPALKVYPLRLPFIARLPMGLRGLSNTDRRRLGYRQSQVRDSEVSQIVGRSHLWPQYFCKPQLAHWIRNYVYFPDHQSVLHVAERSSESEIR